MKMSLGMNPGWVEQASNFWEPSRGIHYMHAVDENIVWGVAYDGSGSTLPVQEFTKTTNGGTDWFADTIDNAPVNGDTAMIYALDDNYAWVAIHSGSPQGIWATTDGGSSWARQDTALFSGAGAFPNCVHFWDQNDGWCQGDPVDGYFEMYTTTDGGANWVRVPSGNIPAPLGGEMGTVGYYDVVGDTVWFGTQSGHRVFKSEDRGLNWEVYETPFTTGAYVDIRFKDALNGIAMDKNFADAELAETSDGGETWTYLTYTGKCHGADFDYVPGTPNMYVSTGVQSGAPDNNGATYSLDGGHSWTSWADVEGIQLFGTTWVDGVIGWAGNFNVDETTGGVYKYTPDANQAPDAPIIEGPLTGTAGTQYDYTFKAFDFESDDIVEFVVDWGDGTPDETITGPFAAGEEATASHTWSNQGTFTITATAEDTEGGVSDEGSLEIVMPRNKAVNRPLFLQFLENHPYLFPILRYLLGLF
jgi:photosystem II stability/assembly factor-like uncharacterized protein